jgi:hypothetical protein
MRPPSARQHQPATRATAPSLVRFVIALRELGIVHLAVTNSHAHFPMCIICIGVEFTH